MSFCKVVLVLFVAQVVCVLSVRPRYQHFEDYLNNLDSNEQSWIANSAEDNNTNTQDANEDNNNNDDDDESDVMTPSTSTSTTTTTKAPYIQDSAGKSKDVTCCMLGQLAGDKGYHCYTQYYAARLIMRNRNRAHNRKMAFYGPQRIQNYGEKLMRTFEQCVAGRGPIFHKCCHLASMERRADRYDTAQQNRYRHQQQQRRHRDDEADDDDDSS